MRVKLSEKYPKEREDICNRLLEILDLKEDNTFLLCDLDEDTLKQEKILAMKEEIHKYFASSEITVLKPNFKCNRPYLNMIRCLFRAQGYTFECGNNFMRVEDGLYKYITKYKIFRNK
jgi:hypothetical protein